MTVLLSSGWLTAAGNTVISWGCGTSCIQFAIVDGLTGKVFFPTEFQSVSGSM